MDRSGSFQVVASIPSFGGGRCPACKIGVALTIGAPYSDNTPYVCAHCGMQTPRRRLILEALAQLDSFAWSLLTSDIYITDSQIVAAADRVVYDVRGLSTPIAKWQNQVAFPDQNTQGFLPYLYFDEFLGYLSVLEFAPPTVSQVEGESSEEGRPIEASRPPRSVVWFRFGLTNLAAVPAWRQSLWAAANLVNSQPAASIVLSAAGFEALFSESMRLAWSQRGLDQASFERLIGRNLAITTLVDWLPATVGLRSLRDDAALHVRWSDLVNKRRNQIMHQANVQFTSEQAIESLRAALEAIEFVDEAALVRPHAYYRGTQ